MPPSWAIRQGHLKLSIPALLSQALFSLDFGTLSLSSRILGSNPGTVVAHKHIHLSLRRMIRPPSHHPSSPSPMSPILASRNRCEAADRASIGESPALRQRRLPMSIRP